MQNIIKGQGTIMQAGELLAANGYKNIFLITGRHYQLTTGFENLKNGIVDHYVKSGPNVEDAEVEEAYKSFLKEPSVAIVAIGGGSVMDLAKAIIYKQVQGNQKIPFFLAAPTTAGSGSEATKFAVIYKDKKKLSLEHTALLPQVVILDPGLLSSLSPYQFAVSGMDVLCQSIEALWNKNVTEDAKQFATEGIKLWNESFLPAVKKTNEDAVEKMLMASHFAGKAISITRSTGPHAMSYYLTSHHGVPHGHAVALFLPLFFIYNQPAAEICSTIGAENPEEAKIIVQQIMKQAGLAITLAELGIDKTAIADKLVNEVNEDRFSNNPVAFNREILIGLIKTHL